MHWKFPGQTGKVFFFAGIVWVLLFSPVSADDQSQMEFFESRVRPILIKHCFECHGEKKQEGGLRTDLHKSLLKGGDTGPAIVPGKPKESELILAINYDADSYQMPPDGKLKQEQIDILTRWVEEGGYWPEHDKTSSSSSENKEFNLKKRAEHWSFQPVKNHRPPEVKNSSWPLTDIDHFVLSRLEQANLIPAKEADKRTLLRRVAFDLTGLPPSTEDIESFLDDSSAGAYSKVVERLLASPHYGERWGRHWLDLVRFAETMGHEFDYTIYHAHRYRDYVIRALNDDIPYSQFVTEHIAGDLLESPRRSLRDDSNESVIATGFYWLGQGKHSPVDIQAEESDCIDNQIDVIGKAFLGLTISCARCHDHKFDPITTKDYYAISGFLQSSRRNYAFIDSPRKTAPLIQKLKSLKGKLSPVIRNEVISKLSKELSQLDQKLLTNNPKPDDQWLQQINSLSKSPDKIFYVWNKLQGMMNESEFLAEKRTLLSDLISSQAEITKQPDSVLFESFESPSWKNWFVTGQAFGEMPSQKWEAIFPILENNSIPIEQLASAGIAHSGLISGKLQGTIRSRTFTISKPKIFYRMLRSGGNEKPGKVYKNGQVSLIIDGFEVIKAPIYGSLTLNIPRKGLFQWYQQDVSKWIGHKAYIEIVDEDDGYIAVDEILFGNQQPLESGNSSLIEMLKDPNIKSPAALAIGYRDFFLKSIHDWKNQSGKISANKIETINQILKIVGSSPVNQDFSKSWKIVSQYRSIESEIPVPQKAIAITDGSPEDESVFIRGNHKKKGKIVPRRFLEVFEENKKNPVQEGSGRLELAKKITSKNNPLISRVVVNRIWHHHFGKGIVRTTDDFGVMGKPPTHPELLDFLASELIRNKWSIKNMHRMMVLSRTYQMASELNDHNAEEKDPENLLLHRMSIRRLEAEAIRDSILSVSGHLNEKMYGPSILPYLTPFMEGRGRPKKSGPLDGDGRRSIYINVRRNFLTPMFLAYDYPTPFTTAGRRSVSNVPAQGLIMMNNPFVIQQSKLWAQNILEDKKLSTDGRIQEIYNQAFARLPSEKELTAAREFLPKPDGKLNHKEELQMWSDYCHVIFNVKEFVFVN